MSCNPSEKNFRNGLLPGARAPLAMAYVPMQESAAPAYESEEALKGYAVHPEHVAVANGKVRPYMVQRSCLDFEI